MAYFQVSASENNNNTLWGQFFLWLCTKAANKDLCFTFWCVFLLIWWFYMSKAVTLGNSLGRKHEPTCLHGQDVYLTTKDGCSPLLTLHTASGVVEIWAWTCVCMFLFVCLFVCFCVCVAWVWREEANKEIKSYKIIKNNNAVDSSQVIHISLS